MTFLGWKKSVVDDVRASAPEPSTGPIGGPSGISPFAPELGLSYFDADDHDARVQNDLNDLTGRVARLERLVADLKAAT